MRKTSVIPSGVTLVGDIEGDADLVVYGRVEGPIHVDGTLVIEAEGVVRGHVHARTVVVRGVLKGNAFGDEVVRVDEGARLVGELTAPRVQVVPGAQFRGQIHVAQVGEPRLTTYDPRLHTFSGWPAPDAGTTPGTLVAPRTSSGAMSAPSGLDAPRLDAPTVRTRVAAPVTPVASVEPEVTHVVAPFAPSAEATQIVGPEAAVAAPTPVEATRIVEPPAFAEITLSEAVSESMASESRLDEDATLSEATTYPPPPEKLPLRMPRLGRTPGSRRWS